ncbi:MAG: PilZ domain-containing protein [Candidatus Omnitrophica bacterium]|nr:PilZ domain-containing protein [Candidatus Omnitrophota bacterium]
MKEDRISRRVEIELPAKFYLEKQPNSWVKAAVVNISTHGFCFRSGAEYNEILNGKPAIVLSIELSKEESVELNVQVAWSGKTSSYNCLAGGEILNPSGSDYQKILEFYTKLFREQSEKGNAS